jgi:hypothetical protein
MSNIEPAFAKASAGEARKKEFRSGLNSKPLSFYSQFEYNLKKCSILNVQPSIAGQVAQYSFYLLV